MQQQTQIDPLETVRSDADERIPCQRAWVHKYERPTLSPLARAALANGVSFEDVRAYCEGRNAQHLTASMYEACNAPLPYAQDIAGALDSVRVDMRLEGALVRSVLAQGTIEHARLWWRGVL